ncbi:hypothetical protein KUTeg_013238 [Tegillarca granosa]|uniref:Uncharacterized protein n=1 Tax=Tegillarca granosa TaxID=220873 RepID=A0ABQ9ET38_TEGGR|nr:hypothetical protein KUTeg_013238 [Tegillarca granosa]
MACREEEEELKYVEFMKEVTEDVLNRGVFTNRVLKQVFETHIRKRKGELNENRMRLMLVQVRNELDIHEDDHDNHHQDYDMEHTLTTTESSDSKLRLSNIPNRYHGTEQTRTFDSTLDSQNTFGLQSTASADMFSTIHSQPSGDLGVTQALQNYQMNISKKEAIEEHSPGEIDEDDEKHSVVSKKSTASRRSAASRHSMASRQSAASKQRSVSGRDKVHQQEGGVKSRMIKGSSNDHDVDDDDNDDVHSARSSLTQSTTSTLKHGPTSVENNHIPSPQHLSKVTSQSGDETVVSSGADKTAQEESEDNEYESDDYEDSGEELITSNRLSDNDF